MTAPSGIMVVGFVGCEERNLKSNLKGLERGRNDKGKNPGPETMKIRGVQERGAQGYGG